jgi:hypothetical protein
MAPVVRRGWPPWYGQMMAGAVLARFGHLEHIPDDPRAWGVDVARAGALALTLARERDRAFLFRDLATLRTDVTLFASVDALEWKGPTAAFAPLAERLAGAAGGSAATSSTFASQAHRAGTYGL